MNIKKINGTVTGITDLSATAKEVRITLAEPLEYVAGCFVNLFVEDNGELVRRAFSVSSDDSVPDSFTLSIRWLKNGRLSSLFWEKDMLGHPVEIMGPLGFNTADKIQHRRVFLAAFGIGVGVIKAVTEHLVREDNFDELTILTGSRDETDIMYKDFFDGLAARDARVRLRYIVTDTSSEAYPKGFIQDHIDDLDFNHAAVYVCGQEVACNALQAKVAEKNPEDCAFFVEAFH